MFYSVPQDELLGAVHELIGINGTLAFQNKCGIALKSFLKLLGVYLRSTIVQHGDSYVVQKQGICIGLSVTPVLCNIVLAKFDSALREALHDSRVVKVHKYADDFLIILNLSSVDQLTHVADQILNVFSTCSKNMVFTNIYPLTRPLGS